MAEITEQIVREAPEIEAYKVGLLKSAKGLSDTPVNIPAARVAGFNPDQIAAFEQARAGIGSYQPYMYRGAENLSQGAQAMGQGMATLQGADTRGQFTNARETLGTGISAVGAARGFYDPNSVNAFMNPYQQNVINAAMDEINRQRDLTAQTQAAQAVRSGAYGGSRQAVQQAELERNTAQTRNQTMAGLLAQGYNQAQAAAMTAYEQGQQRNMAAGQMYGNMAGLQGNLAGQQFNIGQQMATNMGQFGTGLANIGVQQGAMGESAQRMGQQDVNMLYNIGQQQQGLTQQSLEAERNTALQRAYEPYQRLAFLSDIYKGAPSSQQSITAATAPVPSQFQQAVGTGIAGLTAGTAAKKAGLF